MELAMIAGSSVLQGAGSILEGNARADAMNLEASQVQTRGKEEQAARITDLQRTLGAISALTSQRGIDPNSPSALAYAEGVEKDANRNINRTRWNAENVSNSMLREASISRTMGYISAGTSLATGATKALSLFSGGG